MLPFPPFFTSSAWCPWHPTSSCSKRFFHNLLQQLSSQIQPIINVLLHLQKTLIVNIVANLKNHYIWFIRPFPLKTCQVSRFPNALYHGSYPHIKNFPFFPNPFNQFEIQWSTESKWKLKPKVHLFFEQTVHIHHAASSEKQLHMRGKVVARVHCQIASARKRWIKNV
jgi:hypothetical protein